MIVEFLKSHFALFFGGLLFIQYSGCNSPSSEPTRDTSDSTSHTQSDLNTDEPTIDLSDKEEPVSTKPTKIDPKLEQEKPADKIVSAKIFLWDEDVDADSRRVVTPVEIATIDKFNKIFFRVPIHYSIDGESIIRVSSTSRKEDDFTDTFRLSEVVVYDIGTLSLKDTWKSPADEDSSKLFSSFSSKLSMDGSTLGVVWDSANEIRFELWETKNGKMYFEKQIKKAKRDFLSECSQNELSTFEISPNGEKIIIYIACQENIECWNAKSGETEWAFESKDFHFAVGHPIAFSPVKDVFAICNGGVEIRSLSTGNLIKRIEIQNAESIEYQWVDSLRYTKDGDSLLIASRIEYEHPSIRRVARINEKSLGEQWEIETIIGGLKSFKVMDDNSHFVISGLTEEGNKRVEFREVGDGELLSAFEFDPSTDEQSHESNIAVHPESKNVIIETFDAYKIYKIPELSP